MAIVRSCKPPCSRGVTLIEIMIVIAIMLILMGLIMAVIGPIRKRAKESSTRLLLDGIATGMSRYEMEFGDYPESVTAPGYSKGSVDAVGSDFADDGTLYVQMNGTDGLGSQKVWGTPYQKRLEPFLKLQPENLHKEGTNKLVVFDFFSRPIRYFNCVRYLRDNAGDPAKVHNQKVDIWSLGESMNNPDDDIKNWK